MAKQPGTIKGIEFLDRVITNDVFQRINVQEYAGLTKRQVTKLFNDACKEVEDGALTSHDAVHKAVEFMINLGRQNKPQATLDTKEEQQHVKAGARFVHALGEEIVDTNKRLKEDSDA